MASFRLLAIVVSVGFSFTEGLRGAFTNHGNLLRSSFALGTGLEIIVALALVYLIIMGRGVRPR